LAHEATPGVEAICDGAYQRTITVGSAAGYFCVRPVPNRHALLLSLHLPEYTYLKSIIERVRLLFDLGANPTPILHHLEQHPQIASLVHCAKGLRLPGTWNGFEVAVRVLVARDLGADRTPAIMGKLAVTYGQSLPTSGNCRLTTLFPTPATLMQASLADLGLSPRAAHQITRLACAVAHEHLRFDPTMAFRDLVNGLMEVAELDSPSAHWVAMRTLGEPDASPFGAPSVPEVSPCSDTALQETWRPWRSYIAVLLALQSVDGTGVVVQYET
jgi:AraC family transcriptional regulator of adaptative response / DNA-3-methyladenine glycosylase II